MTPEHFVEDVLCKDPEFQNILDNHRRHGDKTKNEDWSCNPKTVQIQSKDYIKLQRCELQYDGELSQPLEQTICKNYLSHHQNTHRHATDQSLGLSYHSRLCDYRIMSQTKPKESVDENLSGNDMYNMELKCCLQRLQMASYLRHKSRWNNGYSNPLVCHAVHKTHDSNNQEIRPREFQIKLRYKDSTFIIVQIFYKTNTECLLRIL